MIVTYLDTSAVMKLFFLEPETAALRAHLSVRRGDRLVSSWLLHTELHCAAGRRGSIPPASLSAVLSALDLVDLIRGDMIAAGALAPLRAQDALHLAVAMRLGVDEMITYDRELTDTALRAGLRVVAPQ